MLVGLTLAGDSSVDTHALVGITLAGDGSSTPICLWTAWLWALGPGERRSV